MITDGTAAAPPDDRWVRLTGLPARELGRTALAGVVAEVASGLLMGLLYLVLRVLLPTCTGDSCIGTPRLWAGVLLSPLVALVAFAAAFLLLRVRRPWGVAGVALTVALVLLGTAAKAAAVTALAPQPYAYEAPRTRLNSLNANDYTKVLELGYITADPSGDEFGDTFVDLHEVGPAPAAARAAECSPALPLGEPDRLCHRLVTPSGATVWRDSGAAGRQLVVALPDATVVVGADVADDAAALALVARLRPVDAGDLLDAAQYVSVP